MAPFHVVAARGGKDEACRRVVERLDVKRPLATADDEVPPGHTLDFNRARLHGRDHLWVGEDRQHVVYQFVVYFGDVLRVLRNALRAAEEADDLIDDVAAQLEHDAARVW